MKNNSGENSGAKAPLELTERAAAAVKALRERGGHSSNMAVRLRLRPEEVLARKYELEFVDVESADPESDIELVVEGIQFVVDGRSAGLLTTTLMDYVEGMWSSGFRFLASNPINIMGDPCAVRVKAVIEQEVNPAVEKHGGVVALMDVRDGQVYVQFGGGCQGCGLAPTTVREVVERIIKGAVPEVRQVVDVTDHAAGEHPYA